MKGRLKAKDIAITCVLAVLLVFFLVIAACQIYEEASSDGYDDRIVLGVGNSSVSGFGTAIKCDPVGVGDYIALVAGGNFTVVDKNAEATTTENFVLTDPIVHAKGRYCVVADYNGDTVRLYENGNVVTEVETEGKIISVTTNATGFFAVATEETGYNAVINVFHKDGDPIYRYRISENTFIDMDISANNRKLIVVEANISSGAVGTNVVLADFNREDAEHEFYVASNLYVNIHFNKDGSFVAVGNESVDFYRADCGKIASVSLADKTLITTDISTDNFVCVAYKGASDGSIGSSTLDIYDKNGKKRSSSVFSEEIESVGINGSYVTIAHGETVDIVKSNGKIKKTFKATSPVKYALAFRSGNAALVFAGGNTSIIK